MGEPEEVYPRVCGGTTGRSSPVAVAVYPRVCGGTGVDPCLSVCEWVYPRVCGGTTEDLLDYEHMMGLSPRLRGNQ